MSFEKKISRMWEFLFSMSTQFFESASNIASKYFCRIKVIHSKTYLYKIYLHMPYVNYQNYLPLYTKSTIQHQNEPKIQSISINQIKIISLKLGHHYWKMMKRRWQYWIFRSVGLWLRKSRSDAIAMSMTHKLDIVVLDANEGTFTVHQEHRRVQRQFELRAGADERTPQRLSAALVPGKLESYQPWRWLHLFCLFQQQQVKVKVDVDLYSASSRTHLWDTQVWQ